MTVELREERDGKILVVRASGKLTKEDYERFIPEAEQLIQQYGKIRVLFDMQDFHGWELSALWEDIKFDLKHFRNIERLAMIGEKKWQAGMSVFCKPFTSAEVRYFDRNEADQAHTWLENGLGLPNQVQAASPGSVPASDPSG